MDDRPEVTFEPLPARSPVIATSTEVDDPSEEPGADGAPRRRRSAELVSAIGFLAAAGMAVAIATHAAFSDTTASDGNAFVTGTVDIDDDDGGVALVGLGGGSPDATDVGCITVTYRGSLAAAVRLYGTTAGTGFDQYVNLTVERGTWGGGPPAYDTCTGFTPDATDYLGAGAGVIYDGTLADFPDSFADGIADGGGTPEVWTTDESRPYRFTVEVVDTNAAQGLNATQTFTWEARNT